MFGFESFYHLMPNNMTLIHHRCLRFVLDTMGMADVAVHPYPRFITRRIIS